MAYIQGKKVLLKFLKDGVYEPFLCATDCAITINTETVDTRTLGDGHWRKPVGQSKSFTVSLTGLIELQLTAPITFWLIENYDLQMLPVDFQMHFEDPATSLNKYITAKALIVTSVLNGVPTGFATSNFEMEGYGALVVTNVPSGCEASIGYIAITDITGGTVTFTYNFVDDAVRIDYSINGGGRESIFDPGVSGTFAIAGLSDGDYTIVFYPVCENGNDGFTNELSFEITGGGGDVCDPPGETFFSDLSNSGFTYNWVAPGGGPPADGYEWQLLNSSLTIIDSGTTTSTSHVFSGLTPGATYHPRVRSICEAGVSLSSWLQDDITLASEPGVNAVSYSFFPGALTGTFKVTKNGATMVETTVIVDNAFGAVDGDEIITTITPAGGVSAEIDVLDTTSSTTVGGDTETGPTVASFTFNTASGHNYQIDGFLT